MLNIEETLKNLKKIKEISKEAIHIDNDISLRVLNDIRTQVHDKIKGHVDKIIEFGLKVAKRNLITEKNMVVVSDYQVLFHNKRGHVQTCTTDNLIIIPIIQEGEKAWFHMDTKDRRFLYLDEFEIRCDEVLEAIKVGVLDDSLREAPNELIHKIMGQNGELLKILNIEPSRGLTYNRIINIIAARV